MQPDNAEKSFPRVIRKLAAVTERITLALDKLPEGKIRVSASCWEDARVVMRVQVLEIRNIDGQIRVAVKDRLYDTGDLPMAPYDPYGNGEVLSAVAGDVAGDLAGDAGAKVEAEAKVEA